MKWPFIEFLKSKPRFSSQPVQLEPEPRKIKGYLHIGELIMAPEPQEVSTNVVLTTKK